LSSNGIGSSIDDLVEADYSASVEAIASSNLTSSSNGLNVTISNYFERSMCNEVFI